MIGLSTTTYDPNGAIVLRERPSNPYTAQRRGSVTATLDGGSSVYDSGYSVSDQTLAVKIRRPSQTTLIALNYLVAYYGQIVVCCETGAYLAVPALATNGDTANLTLRIISQLD